MGSVFKRGNSWVIEYRNLDGRIRRESVGKRGVITKTIAKAILDKRERGVELGREDMLNVEIPAFNEITTDYLQHQKDIKQIRSYTRTEQAVSHFSKIFGDKKLNNITASDIDIYKQRRLKDGIKLNTIVRDLVVIRHLFNFAYNRRKFYGRNPVSESGLPQIFDQKERVLTPVEQDELLKHSSDSLVGIIKLALNTGMRRGEILGLKWEWIDLKESYINLPSTHSKSKKSRRIPINPIVKKILIELKLKSGDRDLVFQVSPTVHGARTWLQREFKVACKKAGIEGIRFHDLRHTAATRLVESGIPLHAVSELLGHSSIRMTERYSHPQESVKKATEILANYL